MAERTKFEDLPANTSILTDGYKWEPAVTDNGSTQFFYRSNGLGKRVIFERKAPAIRFLRQFFGLEEGMTEAEKQGYGLK